MNFVELVDAIATTGAAKAEEEDDGQGGMKLKCNRFSAQVVDWVKDTPDVAFLVDTQRVISNAWNMSMDTAISSGDRLLLGRMDDGRWVPVSTGGLKCEEFLKLAEDCGLCEWICENCNTFAKPPGGCDPCCGPCKYSDTSEITGLQLEDSAGFPNWTLQQASGNPQVKSDDCVWELEMVAFISGGPQNDPTSITLENTGASTGSHGEWLATWDATAYGLGIKTFRSPANTSCTEGTLEEEGAGAGTTLGAFNVSNVVFPDGDPDCPNRCGGTKKGVRINISGFVDCTDDTAANCGTCFRPFSRSNGTYEFLIEDGAEQSYFDIIVDATNCGGPGSQGPTCQKVMVYTLCVSFGCDPGTPNTATVSVDSFINTFDDPADIPPDYPQFTCFDSFNPNPIFDKVKESEEPADVTKSPEPGAACCEEDPLDPFDRCRLSKDQSNVTYSLEWF